jgi:hypothetical protein
VSCDTKHTVLDSESPHLKKELKIILKKSIPQNIIKTEGFGYFILDIQRQLRKRTSTTLMLGNVGPENRKQLQLYMA